MQCNDVKERSVPYLELDLEASLVSNITAHLDGCAACRVEIEGVRQTLVHLKSHAVPDPGERFWRGFPERVRQQLAQTKGGLSPMPPARRRRQWLGSVNPRWGLALAASVMFLVGVWLLTDVREDRVVQRVQSSTAPIKTMVTSGPNSQLAGSEADLPNLDESDWDLVEDEDAETIILVDMAAGMNRRTLDPLFSEI